VTEQIKVEGKDGAVVYIRANRNGYGLRNKILSTASQASAIGGGGPRVPDIWAMNNALLHHNIVKWEGAGLPAYTPGLRFPLEAIDDLDEEFGAAILEKIQEVNKADDPDPKGTMPGESG
jgi:hypothetical protein